MTHSNIAIVIPAFNEEESIGLVLKDIPPEFKATTVVVDNNSTDKTSEVIKNLGFSTVFEERPGYGSACLAGIQFVKENFNVDTYVFLDGDYSDYPEDIYKLLKKMETENLDFVIGSRNLGQAEKGSLYLQARFGNWLATTLLNVFKGCQYTDLGPFRAIRAKSYDLLQMQDTNYGWTMEMQIKGANKKLKASEVSMRYRKRIGTSKISGTLSGSFKAGYKILYTFFKYAWFSRN